MLAKNAEREAAYLRSAYNFYYDNYARLSKQLEQLKVQLNRQNNTYNSCNNQINNQENIEAVKYAMKKSHPDNGGNAEDFKKYRELYNRINEYENFNYVNGYRDHFNDYDASILCKL